MLILLLAGIVFFFLTVGAVAFVLCAAIPQLRRFSLGVALWLAAWGPNVIAWLFFAGLVAVANGFVMESIHFHQPPPQLPAKLTGSLVGCLMIVSGVVFATVVVWLHQVVVDRMTFWLFRLYATVVCAGIGSVLGIAVGIWLNMAFYTFQHAALVAIVATVALPPTFGYLAFRHARELRGAPPTRFTWITPEEFYGTSQLPG